MKIVINIPEEIYSYVNTQWKDIPKNDSPISIICNAVIDGVPLPKGHGDLVDRDAINDRFYNIWKELESYSNKPTYKKLLDRWSMCMDTAQPVIEADEEE